MEIQVKAQEIRPERVQLWRIRGTDRAPTHVGASTNRPSMTAPRR